MANTHRISVSVGDAVLNDHKDNVSFTEVSYEADIIMDHIFSKTSGSRISLRSCSERSHKKSVLQFFLYSVYKVRVVSSYLKTIVTFN